jgi:hypothetical protein
VIASLIWRFSLRAFFSTPATLVAPPVRTLPGFPINAASAVLSLLAKQNLFRNGSDGYELIFEQAGNSELVLHTTGWASTPGHSLTQTVPVTLLVFVTQSLKNRNGVDASGPLPQALPIIF